MSEDTLHDEIAAAYDEVTEKAEAPAPAAEAPKPSPATEAPVGAARERDAQGKFAKKQAPEESVEKSSPPKAEPEEAEAPEPEKAPEKEPEAAADAKEPDTKAPENAAATAPQSWRAGPREHWAALPKEVQEEVLRRERETSVALANSSEARKFATNFSKVVGPFMGMIRSEGSEPLRAVEEMLKVAWVLRASPPETKARAVANLVKQYGISIEQLDSCLAGEQVPSSQGPQGLVEFRDSRLDAFLAQREQTLAREAEETVRKFSETHEFMDQVRDDLGEIIKLRTARGQRCSLEEAYDVACKLHPDIQRVLEQRKAAKQGQSPGVARARSAGSSLRPAAAPQTVKGSKTRNPMEDRRQDVEDALAEVESRRRA